MELQKPSIGRIVHFTDAKGEVRPAVIVRVWTHECVNLEVFGVEHQEDKQPTSVVYGAAGHARTWFWPPRV